MKKKNPVNQYPDSPDAARRSNRYNRNHKDRLFRLLFSDRDNLLQLYNAMRGSHYTNPEDLNITTSEDVIYLGMKNDISFIIDDVLNLYEHQASFNPNMGLRGLLYLADSYRKYVAAHDLYLYSSAPLKLPLPQYVVFYNGIKDAPDRMELRLSDLFEKKDGIQPCLEVTATMLNINHGHNKELMNRCRILWEYSAFIGRIRTQQQQDMELEAAVNEAVDSCIQEGILADFLKAHRAEVVEVVLTEYDEAGYIAYEKRLSREEGHSEGRLEGLLEGLADGELRKLTQLVCKKLAKSKSPEQIAQELEEDPDTVRRICVAAGTLAPDYDIDKIAAMLKKE